MKIFYENNKKEIKNIVQNKAKYQKVMLLFDDNVTNFQIANIYENIKEICIYNQVHINQLDEHEIFNGYRVIIYLCSTNSFLKCRFNREEFINVFCPKDSAMLPYFLSYENKLDIGENYLFLESSKVDIQMIISIYFNRFYNYFKELMHFQNRDVDFSFDNKEITHYNLINYIENFNKDAVFLDIEIIKNCNMNYEDVAIVDLLLVNAFLVLIPSIKNKNIMLVDVYKCAKDDEQLINKFYKLYNNDSFENLVTLNYNYLYNLCIKTKQKIIEYLNLVDVDINMVEEKIEKLKQYSKNSNDIIAYLYIYNIFNV